MNTNPNENTNDHKPQLDTAWSPVADAMRHNLPSPVTKQGNPIDPADPGSLGTRLLALLLTVLVVACVIVWQNTSEDFKFKTLLGKAPAPIVLQPDQSAPGSYGGVDLMGRLFLKNFEMFKNQPTPIISKIDNGSTLFAAEDRIRLIMLVAEFEGTEAALDRIHILQNELITVTPDDENDDKDDKDQDENNVQIQVLADNLIIDELTTLEVLYLIGVDALEPQYRQQLTDRYGLIGKVALTHGLSNTDPLRQPLITGGGWLIAFGFVSILGAVFFSIAGTCLLIFGIIQLASGKIKLRNHVPAKGGSIFLETYCLFVGAFLVMFIATFFVANSSRPELMKYSLVAQWLLLLTVLWGLARGMKSQRWRKAIGWHTGEGVLKEIGIGIIAYIASIPLFIIGILITAILLITREAISLAQNNGVPQEPESLTNPIFELVASGNKSVIIMFFILATTWAPIVEETIFRGALFRHLRSSMHWVFAALLSAFLFGYMHNNGPLMVAPLIALGFMFAFMREWRGSLIAPMTAHFLHNFTLMSFMIILVQLLKDPI
ncbi:MAG: CPBP family intramembrane metalloprotease [Phycisphaerales bacterium]|nr:CPBP family intramembrane metalloprotease [Phycisphaerales bacterium]